MYLHVPLIILIILNLLEDFRSKKPIVKQSCITVYVYVLGVICVRFRGYMCTF